MIHDVFMKAKTVLTWIFAIIVVILIVVILAIPCVYLRSIGKRLQLRPSVKIVDVQSAGVLMNSSQLQEAIAVGRDILNRAE